jgi:acyl carrier protein
MHEDPYALLVRLLHRIAPEVDLDGVDRAAPLQDAAALDSMDFLALMSALYAETAIDVPERDYPLVASVDGFVAYIGAARRHRAVDGDDDHGVGGGRRSGVTPTDTA